MPNREGLGTVLVCSTCSHLWCNAKIVVWCCLATKSLHLDNAKWNGWRWWWWVWLWVAWGNVQKITLDEAAWTWSANTVPSGECNCICWLLPLATHCHTHYHLHQFCVVLLKFKDLVAKQHPTSWYAVPRSAMYHLSNVCVTIGSSL